MSPPNPNSPPTPPPLPPRKPGDKGGPTLSRNLLPVITIMAVLAGFLLLMAHQADPHIELPYAARGDSPSLVALVGSESLASIEVVQEVSGRRYVRYELREGLELDGHAAQTRFKTHVTAIDKAFMDWLKTSGAEVSVPPQNPLPWQILTSVLPVLLVFGLIYFLFIRQMRAAGHGALSFGKSRAKMLNRETNKITFKDVAGIDEAQDEVQEIIEFLKDPKRFTKVGGRIPKGVMLMGPPGTGKTLLAKAIAGEADVPFFSISGSDFVEMFVGVGASRVRDMFEQAKRSAPCIIFVDEIDAVGRSRFTGIGGGHDEREQTLNALLVEMDGFETKQGIIMLAATNRPDVLDPALMRPGRFDRQIVIDLPMIDGREQILKIHARNIKLADTVDLRRIARGTPGFSGADLENLMNEAALLAGRKDRDAVAMEDMEEARDKVLWGRERRSRKIDDSQKKLTAWHEAGHALVQQIVPESEPLHKVTIIPRGVAYLGATMSLPDKDSHTQTRTKLRSLLIGMMGGRSAEELVFGEITTGASQDIKQASELARMMACSWGMSDKLGPRRYGENQEVMFLGREVSRNQNYSEKTAQLIDAEIDRLVREAHEEALRILTENRDKLDMIANLLLQRETIDGRDVEEIVEHGCLLSEDERAEEDKERAAAEEAEAPVPSATEAAAGGESDGSDGSDRSEQPVQRGE